MTDGDKRPVIRRHLRWPGILKPDKPSEAYALALLVVLVVGGITYAVRLVLPAGTPWSVRADKICLESGDAFLGQGGSQAHRLTGQLHVMGDELNRLKDVSIPIRFVLSYNTMLGYKREEVALLKKELDLVTRGSRPKAGEELLGTRQAYSVAAQQLPLSVCGQGTGHG